MQVLFQIRYLCNVKLNIWLERFTDVKYILYCMNEEYYNEKKAEIERLTIDLFWAIDDFYRIFGDYSSMRRDIFKVGEKAYMTIENVQLSRSFFLYNGKKVNLKLNMDELREDVREEIRLETKRKANAMECKHEGKKG